MINNKEFSVRLQKLIDQNDETASSFAQKIGVQRSSISHILSGRNKPSLDFILKILKTYKHVDLYWLINGTEHSEITSPHLTTDNKKLQKQSSHSKNDDAIDRIVIFFKDGSFKNYDH
ncbi:MAG: helix-turn-helix domain-containing protein [Winogradskyella sp.]|nr:helix-turn-helix domain-containing protein [Winogradskyella sp.]